MKISRPVLINGALGVVVVAALVGGYLVIANPFAAKSASATSQLTSTVQQGAVTSSITASGAVAPLTEVNADFAVSGTIATVNTSVGATVSAGDVIGTLDTAALSQTLSQAQTTLGNAKTSLSDAKTALVAAQAAAASGQSAGGTGQGGSGQGSGSGQTSTASAQSQVTSAQSQVNDAANAVTTAQQNLASATLTAPITGLVIAVNGAVGDSTGGGGSSSSAGSGAASSSSSSGGAASTSSSSGSGSGFVTIADVSKMTVTANIAEADIASVTVGQAAKVTFPALTGVTATAKVTAVSPTATASNSVVTYATTITLDSIPTGLRLGQTASVSITTATSKDDALYVPTAAITTATDGTKTVKVVTSSGTKTVTVKTGVVGDAGTQITSGLTLGQTVVIGSVAATTGGTGTSGTGGTGTGTRGGFGGTGTGGFGGTGTGGFGGGNR